MINENRCRNVVWLNPPFGKNVTTSIAKIFLRLSNKYFPKFSRLYKIFNRNTVTVSYSCKENLSQKIKKHNIQVKKMKIVKLKM